MNREDALKQVVKDIKDNRKAVIAEIVNAGVSKEELMGYVSGEVLLINASEKLQFWIRDNDPETYLLEMAKPMPYGNSINVKTRDS